MSIQLSSSLTPSSMQRCRWEKGCLYAPGLSAARSLLDNWRVRCEVPGRLWLGVTSPDQACPYRRVGVWHCRSVVPYKEPFVERSGSGVELRTLDYENPRSNPGCCVKTLGKFFHSTLVQFTQLNK